MSNDSVNPLRKVQREVCRSLSKIGLTSTRTNYFGLPLTVPLIHGTGRQLIVPDEYWMSRCLKRFLAMKKGAVLDIGVNVGLYLVKLRALDGERPYVGFEPNPFCNYYVQELIRLNRFANARVLPVALSAENKVGKLLAGSRDDSGASILEDVRTGTDTSFSVDTLFWRGDDLVAQLGLAEGVGIVKIDVEGAESYVIAGLADTIRAHRPLMYCEIGAPFANTSPDRQQAAKNLWAMLSDLNYRVLGVSWDASLHVLKAPTELDKPYSGEYILAHADDLASLMMAFEAERGIPISKHEDTAASRSDPGSDQANDYRNTSRNS